MYCRELVSGCARICDRDHTRRKPACVTWILLGPPTPGPRPPARLHRFYLNLSHTPHTVGVNVPSLRRPW